VVRGSGRPAREVIVRTIEQPPAAEECAGSILDEDTVMSFADLQLDALVG
jgi:hypothetical protein